MTFRQKLLSAPKRPWNKELHNVRSLYVIPTRRKHDSGYNCMIYVAAVVNGDEEELVQCGGYSDHLWMTDKNAKLRTSMSDISMDCVDGVLRLYHFCGAFFQVGWDGSTVEISPEK